MAKISVLGLGNWGTALANHLALGGHDVLGWSIEPALVSSINSSNRNPTFQSDVLLSENLRATEDLEEALENSLFLFVLPSAALQEVVPKLRFRCTDRERPLFISATKGIEVSSLLTPLQFAEANLPVPADLAVLSGPSFARDVIVQRPSGVVAACKSEEVAREVAELFGSEAMKIYLSTDPLGVELGGIVKNAIALAAGVCDGIGLGDSARAGLITRGLAEMTRFAVAMGAEQQTLFGLSGLGDLVMTATCDTSRNRTVGLRLGRGESLSEIIDTLGSVAEGVKTTPLVLQLAQKCRVEMPIVEQVYLLLKGDTSLDALVRDLLSRPLKHEF